MMVNSNDKNILITTAVVMISAILSTYSIVALVIAFFLVCTLNAYTSCKFGIVKTLMCNLLAIVFCAVHFAISQTLDFANFIHLPFIMLPGIIFGISFKKKLDFKDTFIFVNAFYFVAIIAFFALCKYIFEISITDEFRSASVENYEDQIGLFKSLYPSFAQQFENIESQIFNLFYVVLPGIVPFSLFVLFAFTFLTQYAFCKMACVSFIVNNASYKGGFDTFKLGLATNVVMLFSIVTLVFETSSYVFMIFVNVLLSIFVLYFVSGLSFLEYKLKERAMCYSKRFAIILLIVIGSIFVTVFIPIINIFYVLIILGFLDSIFDFRRLNSKKEIK